MFKKLAQFLMNTYDAIVVGSGISGGWAAKELTEKGYKFIYPEPRIGAGGCLVNFMHPKSTGGVLIELSQRPEKI